MYFLKPVSQKKGYTMALINCPECNNMISDKAESCPNCGLPGTSFGGLSTPLCPEFPQDLTIGKQISGWALGSTFYGTFDWRFNNFHHIRNGSVSVSLHREGLLVSGGLTYYTIHKSQIIDLRSTVLSEPVVIKKSVVGRAVVGSLILGPLGAIVGGMSGIGSKGEKVKDIYLLEINFWEIETRVPQTLLISGHQSTIPPFIDRFYKEIKTTL